VIALANRILSTLALMAAVLWVAFPAVVVAAANPAHEPCSCCEGQAALGGVIACPACQVGTAAETALPVAILAVTPSWPGVIDTSATGIDPIPAEPPPR